MGLLCIFRAATVLHLPWCRADLLCAGLKLGGRAGGKGGNQLRQEKAADAKNYSDEEDMIDDEDPPPQAATLLSLPLTPG